MIRAEVVSHHPDALYNHPLADPQQRRNAARQGQPAVMMTIVWRRSRHNVLSLTPGMEVLAVDPRDLRVPVQAIVKWKVSVQRRSRAPEPMKKMPLRDREDIRG